MSANIIENKENFSASEVAEAKEYWSGIGVKGFYQEEAHWSVFLAEKIIELKPKKVLEFGCNIGKNLAAIQKRDNAIELVGVDINNEAVLQGNKAFGLNLQLSDEEFLYKQEDNAFDIIFTVSVLDHLPDPAPILEQMVRVAKCAVFLLEPDLGADGKVVKNIHPEEGELVDTTPYSYSWNYEELSQDLPVSLEKIHYPLNGTNLGPYYFLYILRKKQHENSLARDRISQAYLGQWGGAVTQERARKRIDWLAVNAEGPEILDIGCSEGILPILLGREGNNVIGIDVNPESLAYAKNMLAMEEGYVRNNVSFLQGNILSPDDSKSIYDTVIIAEVVEHLFQPQTALKNAVAKVKDGGRILLTTPFGYFPDPDHHQTFTVKDIVRLLESFCVIEHASVEDGYIRVIGKKIVQLAVEEHAIPTEKLLEITEDAAIEAQKQLRSTLTGLLNAKGELAEINKDLVRVNQDLLKRFEHVDRKCKDLANVNRELTEALEKKEENLTVQRQKVHEVSIKYKHINKKFKALKGSEAWKVGYVTMMAFKKPGKNTILWVPRLIKILLLWVLSPKKKKKEPRCAQPKCRQDRIFNVKNVAPVKLEKTTSFQLRKAVTGHNLSDLRVACVMDEFTYNAYAPECNLLQLTPDNWVSEIESFEPDLLLIESAWCGKRGLWNRKVNYPGGELSQIIAWCNKKLVPTAFWNKEDPIHFQTFINRAKLFDFVFTTDINCICSYKKALQSDRVYLLPFAAQPALHNPIEKYDRKNAFCFAGAYYPRYPARMEDFTNFFDALADDPGFDIFDRNYDDPDSEFAFPEKFRSHILGYLPHDKIDLAYKGYRYGINMNSIKNSSSMFARRVFELIASNTITVSNYSRGVRYFFGDLVIATDNAGTLRQQLSLLKTDEIYYRKNRLMALRKVLLQHTYTDRLAYLAEKIWHVSREDTLPFVNVITLVSDDKQLDHVVRCFNRQNYAHKKLYIVLADNFVPVSDYGKKQVITWEKASVMEVGELVQEGYVAGFYQGDYYGRNYILDIMLATRYTQADALGKKTIIHYVTGEYTQHDGGHEYQVVEQLGCRSAILHRTVAYRRNLLEWLQDLPAAFVVQPGCFSVDAFNYCKGFVGEFCPVADDLPGMNEGMGMYDIEQLAEDIVPGREQNRLRQLEGREFPILLCKNLPDKVRLREESGSLAVSSMLDGDESKTIKSAQFIRLEENHKGNNLKLFFETAPGLRIELILFFFDKNCNKLSQKVIEANRNYSFSNLEFDRFQLSLRVHGRGNGAIHRLVFDNIPVRGKYFPGKSEILLLTPRYPSYDNIYCFGFVHSRVVQYRQLGISVDVLRVSERFREEFFEYNNIDVVSGSTDILSQALEFGQYSTVLIHYLTQSMWNVLREYVDRVPLIIWLHGADVQPWHRRQFNNRTVEEEQKAKKMSEKRMLMWRDVFSCKSSMLHFVFVSRQFADEVMEDVGITLAQERFSIIHNTIDIDLFSYLPKSVEQRKKILSIRPYASPTYANDLTVKAILELSQNPIFSELEFRLIGDGELFDDLLQPLRNFDNVIIEKRFLKQEEIAELHRDYGIFLTPTRMDSQGVSRDEAMSSGLVPITNSVAAVPEFVDEQCGMLVDGEDYKGISEAILRLYHDPDLFLRLSENAAARVRRQSSPDLTVGKEISLIKSMQNG